MLQYFYLVNHTCDNETRINDKIFLQEEKAINWGRKQATKFPENNYWLQRCPITATGIMSDYKTYFLMKNNNIVNRLFHKSEILENKKQYILYKKQVSIAPLIINALKNSNKLYEILEIHRNIPEFSHPCIDPDPWGRFRCKSIHTMSPEEVYLGGIYGLNTYTIPYWEQHINDLYGVNGFGISEDKLLYEIVLNQYKNILINTIQALYNKALKEIVDYELHGYK